LGIGVVDPAHKLEVYNGNVSIKNREAANAQLRLDAQASAQGDVLFLEDGVLSGLLRFDTDSKGGTLNFSDRINMQTRFYIDGEGYVGVGTTSPKNKLEVAGTIRAEEVIVEAQPWADYVFEDGYDLLTLNQVEKHIEQHGHLPGVPSSEDVESEGVSLGDTQRILLEKIEEMTLYIIDQNKRMEEKDRQIENLLSRMEAVEATQ